jgi:hypothetical protein
MAADYHSIRDRVYGRFPFMRSSDAERHALFGERGLRVRKQSSESPSIAPAA